jgi:hypothetical protein
VNIKEPTWCELIVVEAIRAPIAPAIRPATRKLRAYTFNAAPPRCCPWRTPAYNKAVYGGHAWCGARWCTSVYGRCTRGARTRRSSSATRWLNQYEVSIVKANRPEPASVLSMSSAAWAAKGAA